MHQDVLKRLQMERAAIADRAKVRALLAYNGDEGQMALAGHSTPRAGTPSSPDRTAERPVFPAHRGHRNGVNPSGAAYRAGSTPRPPRAASPQGSAPRAGSAPAPKDETFSHRARSSLVSARLCEREMAYRKR